MVKRYITRNKRDDNQQQNQQDQSQNKAAKNSLTTAGQQILTEKIEKLYLQLEVLKIRLANAKSDEDAQRINQMVTNASRELAGVLQVGQVA